MKDFLSEYSMDDFEIIETSEKAWNATPPSSGCRCVRITEKDIESLKNGKTLYYSDGEYSTYVVLSEGVDSDK